MVECTWKGLEGGKLGNRTYGGMEKTEFQSVTKSTVPKLNVLQTCTSLGHCWVIPEEPHIFMCVFSEEKKYHSSKFYHLKVVYFINLLWLEKLKLTWKHSRIQESFYITGFSERKSIKVQPLIYWCTNHSLIHWFFYWLMNLFTFRNIYF